MANAEYLREELAQYDGRNPAILSEVSERHRTRQGFLSELIVLAPDDEAVISEAATWILKAEIEDGQALAPHCVEQLILCLNGVTAWQAQLHICQSIGKIDVPHGLVLDLSQWLETLLVAPRPFLRAWALDALCQLQGSSPETNALLAQMETDDAASVRARVRNLRRKFGSE